MLSAAVQMNMEYVPSRFHQSNNLIVNKSHARI